MKCIILASGRGTRLAPFTDTRPKPLIKVAWKSIIEHNLESIYQDVEEIIIVVKYLAEQFLEQLWVDYKGTPIRYVKQSKEKWTWAALRWMQELGDCVLMYGDSIFEKQDIEQIVSLEGYGCLVQQVAEPSKYWIFVRQVDGSAMKVIEKPTQDYWNLASVWVFKFSEDIFKLVHEIGLSERDEFELTDAMNLFCMREKFQLIEMQGAFIDIWYPWQILEANSSYLSKLSKSDIQGVIEDNVHIKGNIILQKGAILKSGTYIEWNCIIWEWAIIGPNAYIRGNTVIGTGSKVWNAVEIKNSSIGEYSSIAHLSYIWDSILGNYVNVGWGTITANLRHDKKNMRCMIKGELIDTGMKKLWAIIWDGAKIGIQTSIYPGRIIETNATSIPADIIK